MPVMKTRRRRVVPVSLRDGAVGRDRLGDRLERRERPRRDRAGEAAVDEGGPGRHARSEVVVDLDPAAGAARFDPPRDVHAVGRAALVDEPQPERRLVAPRPRPPRDRQREAQRRHERPPGDHLGDERATGLAADRPDRDVMGEQPRPALDVAGEPEDELRRRVDVDPDRASHQARTGRSARRRTGQARRAGCRPRSSGPNHAHVSVEPSTSSRSSPPTIRIAVDDADEVEVGALGERSTIDTRARTRPRSPRSRRRGRSPRGARESPRHPGARRSRRRRRAASTRRRRPRSPTAGPAGSGLRRRDRSNTRRGGSGRSTAPTRDRRIGHRPALTAGGARRGTAGRGRGSRARGLPSRGPSSHGPRSRAASRRAA